MSFYYHDDQLYAEAVPVAILAQRWGTPCYIYSRAAIEQQWQAFDHSLKGYPHRICYAVKANSNLAVLNLLARLGSGFDTVSGGELSRVLAAGGKAEHTIFSGVGKQAVELQQALAANIYCINVESSGELLRLNQLAGQWGLQAPIALRINPDIAAGTHPYITTGRKENKFGIALEDALALYKQAQGLPHIKILGIACHIGSQLTDMQPFLGALERVLELSSALHQCGIMIKHVDLGGGLGIDYRGEQPPSPAAYGEALLKKLRGQAIELIIEPGRAIVAQAGLLLTQVEYLKHTAYKNFVIVDAGMNDLIRPALYEAWQDIIPVTQQNTLPAQIYDVVGPVCETGDFLGKERELHIASGDLLAICAAGAYGFTMSSNYNTRPRAAEIMVDKDKAYLIRRREEINELFATEQLLPL